MREISGIEEARALEAACRDFSYGIAEALDLGQDGRFDDPATRRAAISLSAALSAALE